MLEPRKCRLCNGIETLPITYCEQCGHEETFHNYKFTGQCSVTYPGTGLGNDTAQPLQEGEQCSCVRLDILEKKKAISIYNATYNEWHEPFVLKCTCENPDWELYSPRAIALTKGIFDFATLTNKEEPSC